MKTLLAHFGFSVLVIFVGLTVLFVYGSWEALFIAVLLVLLEVTLSFDNAVMNAKVLERMNAVWQRRFLTWGIFIAVFVTRFVLPIVIVSVVTWASPWAIMHMAFFDPAHYGELLEGARYAIHSFGAAFLLLVAFKYFLDTNKKLHWIQSVEAHLTKWGKIEAIKIVLVLLVITGTALLLSPEVRATVMVAGVFGVVLFILMQGLTGTFSTETKTATSHSVALFVYLEVLDASFSLDGVIGAFALTSSVLIIAVGLGVGAFFVRSLTIYMVKEKTLDTLRYLEHGAHWAIFCLAVSMLVSTVTDVPELVTGTIGVAFVLAAYYSSLKKKRAIQA